MVFGDFPDLPVTAADFKQSLLIAYVRKEFRHLCGNPGQDNPEKQTHQHVEGEEVLQPALKSWRKIKPRHGKAILAPHVWRWVDNRILRRRAALSSAPFPPSHAHYPLLIEGEI